MKNENIKNGFKGAVMPSLPFKIKSITVENTGLSDTDVESILWIDDKRICISNKVECVYDDGTGGTCVSSVDEFEWSFKELDVTESAYVLILLCNEV